MEKAKIQDENLRNLKSMSEKDKIDLINFLLNFKEGIVSGNGVLILLPCGDRVNITAVNHCDHQKDFERFKNRVNSPYRKELLDDGREICHYCKLPIKVKISEKMFYLRRA